MTTPSKLFSRRFRFGLARPILWASLTAAIVVLSSFGTAFAADTPVATVPVGASPAVVAVDPLTHNVFVGNYYGDSVSVIDGVTRSAVATIPMPTGGSIAVPIAAVVDVLERQGVRRQLLVELRVGDRRLHPQHRGDDLTAGVARRRRPGARRRPFGRHSQGVRGHLRQERRERDRRFDRHDRQEHPGRQLAAGDRRVRERLAPARLRGEPLQQQREHHRREHRLGHRHGADRRRVPR